MADIRDNPNAGRFELEEGGALAYADYRRETGRWVIPYVYAPPELRGTGAAGRLMQGVAARAREAGVRLLPTCSYAAAWLRRHREWADVSY